MRSSVMPASLSTPLYQSLAPYRMTHTASRLVTPLYTETALYPAAMPFDCLAPASIQEGYRLDWSSLIGSLSLKENTWLFMKYFLQHILEACCKTDSKTQEGKKIEVSSIFTLGILHSKAFTWIYR